MCLVAALLSGATGHAMEVVGPWHHHFASKAAARSWLNLLRLPSWSQSLMVAMAQAAR